MIFQKVKTKGGDNSLIIFKLVFIHFIFGRSPPNAMANFGYLLALIFKSF